MARLSCGARVYLRATPRRPFVAGVIAPVAQTLADQYGADQIHVASGWRHGAHFDVRAVAPPGRPIDWDDVAGTLAGAVRAHPAPVEQDSDEEYLRTATLLGRVEAVPPPYLPRHPHGHTELLPPAVGPLASLRAIGLAHLLAPLTEAAALESHGAVLARVAEAFVALAAAHPHGVRFGTFSLRSHAEAFFHYAGPGADYRSSFESRMGKDRAVLEDLVRRERAGTRGAPAAAWSHAFNACMADFVGQVTDDAINRAIPDAGLTPPIGGSSAFHAAVAASGVIEGPPAWFAGYRLTINLFYQLLPALDISPVRRFYLCHAIAETVDTVHAETWQSRLAAVEAMMAGAR